MMKRNKRVKHILSRQQLLLRTLMTICIAGILGSAYILYSEQREYDEGDAAYEQVRAMKLREPGTEEGVQDSTSADFLAKENKKVDFAALKQVNADVMAWIAADDRIIDYPIVQGTDNEYYLTHLFTGSKNKLGTLFVDYRTPGDFSEKSTVIYGHNMKDGSMFASLTQYKDQEYYDGHPYMQLFTPDGAYRIEFFAGIVADGDYEFIQYDFDGDSDFLAYIETLKSDSTFRSDVSVNANERIVALCTCSYEFNNARYALFGKLVLIE